MTNGGRKYVTVSDSLFPSISTSTSIFNVLIAKQRTNFRRVSAHLSFHKESSKRRVRTVHYEDVSRITSSPKSSYHDAQATSDEYRCHSHSALN